MTDEKHSLPLWIAGQARVGSGERGVSINPANGRVNHELSLAGEGDIDQAVTEGHRALTKTGWSGLLPHLRARVLHRIADAIDDAHEQLARAQMIENGKIWQECVSQAKSAAATFRYYAAVCESVEDAVTPARGSYLSLTRHEPLGVIGAITPWNSPLTMEAQKIAPALAAGNAVVLKPSELTSLPALTLVKIAEQAGLPPGLLNVTPGLGIEAGAALVRHPAVGMITFTGGTATGKAIAQEAAKRLIPTALELGGKSPHIIFEDADLDKALDAVIGGIFEGSGQSCVAGSRVFIAKRIFEEFTDRLVKRTKALQVGDPKDPVSQMGPVVSFPHLESISQTVQAAETMGAEVLAGGYRVEVGDLRKGAYYAPTLLGNLRNTDKVCQTEIFGPVACLLTFDTEQDLLEQANDSVYGLAAGVWSSNTTRALRVANALSAGTVWINAYKQLSISTPFGGYKESGLGREKGIGGLRIYQQTKSVYLGLS